MTDAQKWREIAAAFANGDPARREGLNWSGLCYAGGELKIGYPTYPPPMINLFCPEGGCGWFWTMDRKGDNCRVIAALLLAEMAEDET